MTTADIRTYEAEARTTDTFGRVLCTIRNHHFIVDRPVQNGCPGEEKTPGELFLSGVACCAVELIEVLSRQEGIPLRRVQASISGVMDRSNPVRPDVTLFNSVHLGLRLGGVSQRQAEQLADLFQRRCPLYGTVAVATPEVEVEVAAEP
jgi:uncharacterized OsmC-like protein